MAKKKKVAVPDAVTIEEAIEAEASTETVECEPEAVATMPEPRRRISGDELAGMLRQQRKDQRMKEKGY